MMYVRVISIALIIFLSACKLPNKYTFEDDMLDCYCNQLSKEGINIKEIADSLEQIFIKYQILESGSGESYIGFIGKIHENKEFPSLKDKGLHTELDALSFIPTSIFCYNPNLFIDTTIYYESKYVKLLAIFDSIENDGEISIKKISGRLLKLFDKEDFEHDLYRIHALIIIPGIYDDIYLGITSGLLSKQKYKQIDENDILTVFILDNDKILVNNEEKKLDELKSIVRDFLMYKCSRTKHEFPVFGEQEVYNGIISLQNEKSVSYEMYIRVHQELVEMINGIRNDYSKKFFGTDFVQLNESKKTLLKKLCPMPVSEAESKLLK